MINNKVLLYGDSGEDVKIIQQLLKILNLFPYTITGSYDKNTEDSVKNFQFKYNLEITGIVDNITYSTLKKATAPKQKLGPILNKPVLRLGDSGEEVKELQTKLNIMLYYFNTIDGNFDLDTEQSVKSFQYNNRIAADGIVGKDTWSALEYLYSPLEICDDSSNEALDTSEYTVKKGDSLYSIAKKYNTTVEEIKRINNLSSNILNIGDVLELPSNNKAEIYIVKKGDSLYKIANMYNTTVEKIKQINNLSNDLLSIGQELKIPNSDLDKNADEEFLIYIVKQGDSLYSIAKRYNTTINRLKQVNGIENNIIYKGQKILIPVESNDENKDNFIAYTVKRGDSLYSIARKYNISVSKIKNDNNLSSDLLSIGQELKIYI